MIHTDTLGEYYNMFTYLSDVQTLGDGPFTYVPGSHLRRDLLTKGAFFLGVGGKHPKEYPELRDRAVPMLGRAGTVIIANHRGVHGAHPQRQGGYRAMLIINFLSNL
jgi:ectoine hydroxylase-related dioxygenase (phytanoyl-CoA dioxygenase family)